MTSLSEKKPPFPAKFEIIDRSLAAFASWNEDLGECEFEDSDAFSQLKSIAHDMKTGQLSRAFDPCNPFETEE